MNPYYRRFGRISKEKKRDWIDYFIRIFSILLPIVALVFSVWQYRKGKEMEAASNRPFLSIEGSKVMQTSPTTYVALFKIINYGKRSAYNISYDMSILLLNNLKNIEVVGHQNWKYANFMVPTLSQEFISPALGIPMDSVKIFYKLNFYYTDEISKEKYSDSLYYSWRFNRKDTGYTSFTLFNLNLRDSKRIDSILYPPKSTF